MCGEFLKSVKVLSLKNWSQEDAPTHQLLPHHAPVPPCSYPTMFLPQGVPLPRCHMTQHKIYGELEGIHINSTYEEALPTSAGRNWEQLPWSCMCFPRARNHLSSLVVAVWQIGEGHPAVLVLTVWQIGEVYPLLVKT